MPSLPLTPIFQPRLKFSSKQSKASYFDRYARPIPKHNPLRYSFTNTITEHQKSFGIGALPMSC